MFVFKQEGNHGKNGTIKKGVCMYVFISWGWVLDTFHIMRQVGAKFKKYLLKTLPLGPKLGRRYSVEKCCLRIEYIF